MSAKLFTTDNFENEIFRSMEKQLVSNQVETTYGFNKLAKATELLSAAAEIFEQAGMSETSEEITEVLQSLTEALQ